MSSTQYHRFTSPNVLIHLHPERWIEFCNRFRPEFDVALLLPLVSSRPVEQFYKQLLIQFLAKEGLPPAMQEALVVISELATKDGVERIMLEASTTGKTVAFQKDLTSEENVMKLWLEDKDWLEGVYDVHHLLKWSSFGYFRGPPQPTPEKPFQPPTEMAMKVLLGKLDTWFAGHGYGETTAKISVFETKKEYWFIVDHGATMVRKAVAVQQRRPSLRFRPARDDLVVYCPELNEIRVSTRKPSIRELYRKEFGLLLFGDDNYFHKTVYSLEPLRTGGQAALETRGVEGIERVRLKKLEVLKSRPLKEVWVHSADDLFEAAKNDGATIPSTGDFRRAVFEFHFKGVKRGCIVEVRPQNSVNLNRPCDVLSVHRWLAAHEYRTNATAI